MPFQLTQNPYESRYVTSTMPSTRTIIMAAMRYLQSLYFDLSIYRPTIFDIQLTSDVRLVYYVHSCVAGKFYVPTYYYAHTRRGK